MYVDILNKKILIDVHKFKMTKLFNWFKPYHNIRINYKN